MNHQPFEDQLLDPARLDAKQKQELNEHLRACPNCSALAEVELALHASRMAEPAAGFTGRFQARLVERKQVLRRRHILGWLLLTAGVAGVLTWLSFPTVAAVAVSPVNTLSDWLARAISLWTSLHALGHVSRLLFETLPDMLPPFLGSLALLGACGWFLIWVLSIKKFVKIPQGA